MKNYPHTISFIVDGYDYFVANTDDGGARVGLKGETCLQIPADHELIGDFRACKTEHDAEALFDRCAETGHIGMVWMTH